MERGSALGRGECYLLLFSDSLAVIKITPALAMAKRPLTIPGRFEPRHFEAALKSTPGPIFVGLQKC